jgi:hypothetical protein
VWRHAEIDDILLLAAIAEFDRVVALMAVDYKQPIPSDSRRLCMRVEVL